jgi:hypothetical protein
MRPLLALLLLLSFGSVQAAVNTDGLPAGAAAVVAFDLTAFRASKVGQAIESLASLKAKDLEASRKFSEQLGIDTKKDLQDFVVAIYPGSDGKVAEKSASGVVLIRGRFLPTRINAFGQSNQLPSKSVGKHQAWEAAAFIEKLSGEKPKQNARDAYVVAHSENLVVIAGSEFLERALAAADSGEKSAQFPAAVAAKFAASPKAWLHLYADATKMKNAAEDVGAEDLSLVLGENADDLRLAIAARFVNAEKAAKVRQQIAGLQAFAAIGLSNDEGKSPAEKENLAMLAELVQKMRIGGEGQQATLDVAYPADKVAKAITQAIEKAQRNPAAK